LSLVELLLWCWPAGRLFLSYPTFLTFHSFTILTDPKPLKSRFLLKKYYFTLFLFLKFSYLFLILISVLRCFGTKVKISILST
jgi:hypothetical protein